MNHPPSTPLKRGTARTPDERVAAEMFTDLPDARPDRDALDRVWRRLPPPRPRARLWWVPAVAVGAIAVVLLLHSPPREPRRPEAELVLASGGVSHGRFTEPLTPGLEGQPLAAQQRLRTDDTGRALLRIDHLASVLLSEDGELAIERLDHGTLLRLARGVLTARVSKRPADEPFLVQTERYRVKVVGTLFSVALAPDNRVAVSVREGTVEVSDAAGHVARVTAGSSWASEWNEPRGIDHTSDATRTLLEESLAGAAATELTPRFRAVSRLAFEPVVPEPSPTPHVAPEPIMDAPPRVLREVAPSVPRTPVVDARPPVAEAPLPVALLVPAAPEHAAPPTVHSTPAQEVVHPQAPVVADRPVTAAQPVAAVPLPPTVESKGPYLHSRELREQGDYAGAARELQRSVDSEPRFAEDALYELGTVRQQYLHDPSGALEAFEKYRLRFSSGTFVPDVDFAILQLQADGGHQARALEEANHFLAAHSELTDQADQVRLLRGKLYSDRGEFAKAVEDYRSITRPASLDDATFSIASCQQQLGDRAGAEATLRSYLIRFPNGRHHSAALHALGQD